MKSHAGAARRCPPEDLLLSYAAGNTPEGLGLVVAAHVEMCPACRAAVAALEDVGGALLDAGPSGAPQLPGLAPGVWEGLLARLDEPEPAAPAAPAPVEPGLEAILPAVARPYAAGLRWRQAVPFIRVMDLPVRFGDRPVQLIRFDADLHLPRHRHDGTECQVVLAGGYRDDSGAYARGDLQLSGPEFTHNILTDPGEPCVVLQAKERPVRATGLIGGLLAWIGGF